MSKPLHQDIDELVVHAGRHLEDQYQYQQQQQGYDLNYYQTNYDDGKYSYPFGEFGSDSPCNLEFYYDYSHNVRWSATCYYDTVVYYEHGQRYRRTKYCYGMGEDFDNFSCQLVTMQDNDEGDDDSNNRYTRIEELSWTLSCSYTTETSCTCDSAMIREIRCESCDLCSGMSHEAVWLTIATWTESDDPAPLQLSCAAAGNYADNNRHFTCPSSSSSSSSGMGQRIEGKDVGFFFGGLVMGAVASFYFYNKTRRSGKNDATSADYVRQSDGVVA